MQWQDALAMMLGLAVVSWVAWSILDHWRQSGARAQVRGKMKEAQDWLDGNGYRVVRARVRGEWIGYYDQRAFRKPLIADFVVRKGARYYAVKVMNARDQGVSGQRLRDQWYPLAVGLNVHGILHLDMERESVHVVDFDVRAPAHVMWRRVLNRSLWLLAGVVVALAWLNRR